MKPKINRKPKNRVILSFLDEEEQQLESEPSFKLKRAVAPLPSKFALPVNQHIAYSAVDLEYLKNDQKASSKQTPSSPPPKQPSLNDAAASSSDSLILDSEKIQQARKSRQERRDLMLTQEVEQESTLDFIELSISSKNYAPDKQIKHESRLVTEDQEIDDLEAYDDNIGSQINFGSTSIAQAEKLRKSEFVNNLRNSQLDTDQDDDVLQWEIDLINSGVRKSHKNSVVILKAKKRPAPKFPAAKPLPSFMNKLSALTNQANLISRDVAQLEKVKVVSINRAKDIMANLNVLEQSQILRSEKYTFYAGLKTFLDDFASLLAAKLPLIQKVEQELFALHLDTSLLPHQYQAKKLSTISELEDIFDDVDDDFKSLPHIIKKFFIPWQNNYDTEYTNCHATFSIFGIVEIFLRLEMLSWEPFRVFRSLESFQWHKDLTSIDLKPSVDCSPLAHLSKCVSKHVLPRVIDLFNAGQFDIFDSNCVDAVVCLYSDLENYELEDGLQVCKRFIPTCLEIRSLDG